MKNKIINLLIITVIVFTIGCDEENIEGMKTCPGYQNGSNSLYFTPDSILLIRTLNMVEQSQYFRIYREKGNNNEFIGTGINSINKDFKFTLPNVETEIYKIVEDMFNIPDTILDYQDPYACYSENYLDGPRTKIILEFEIGLSHSIHYIKNLDDLFNYIMDNLVSEEL